MSGIIINPYRFGVAGFENTYSMEFDGIDESIEVDTPFTTSGNDVTISFWAKLPNLGAGADYMFGGNTNNQMWYDSNEVIKIKIGGWYAATVTTGVGGVPVVFDNTWHHFAVTKTGSTANFWLDGSDYVDVSVSNLGGFYVKNIAAHYNGGSGLTGNMDEVAIWESDQTSNMATIYNGGTPGDLSSLSPLFWLRMGDASSWDGSVWTLTDQGSGGNDATSVNMEEADRKEDVPT